uniref:Uncharacterized protein n=1 Tax=Aegilops tauschii subsp. strangulata TaxID=200361 RepID=A0A453DMA3_AEGTS
MLQLVTTKSWTMSSMGYYLTNGIYQKWATLVKSIKEKNGVPLTRKLAHFTKAQEAAHKDIE